MLRILHLLLIVFTMLASIVSSLAAEDGQIEETKWRVPFIVKQAIEAPVVAKQEPMPNSIQDDAGSNTSLHELTPPEKILESSETKPLTDAVEEITGRPYNAPGWYSAPDRGGETWHPGSGDRFGAFSLENVVAEPDGEWEELSSTNGFGVHFLTGPTQTDLPPRVFDFKWGLHWFGEISDRWWVDLAFSVGLYTDFEDSVSEGWRFPSHTVVTWEFSPEVQPVAGVRYFDRNNLGLLPVAGLILRPDDRIRIELVYPEPRVAWRVSADLDEEYWISLSGRIGGGEWAIERIASGLADVATYNDYQIVLAPDIAEKTRSIESFEIGYVFERDLKYRSGRGNFDPPETFFIRMVIRK
jgi:hypothetical protein